MMHHNKGEKSQRDLQVIKAVELTEADGPLRDALSDRMLMRGRSLMLAASVMDTTQGPDVMSRARAAYEER